MKITHRGVAFGFIPVDMEISDYPRTMKIKGQTIWGDWMFDAVLFVYCGFYSLVGRDEPCVPITVTEIRRNT